MQCFLKALRDENNIQSNLQLNNNNNNNVPADHRIKLKLSERKDKYLDRVRELK